MDEIKHDRELIIDSVALLDLHAELLDDLLTVDVLLRHLCLTPHRRDDVEFTGEHCVDKLSMARCHLVPGRPRVPAIACLRNAFDFLKTAALAVPFMRHRVDDENVVACVLGRLDGFRVSLWCEGRVQIENVELRHAGHVSVERC